MGYASGGREYMLLLTVATRQGARGAGKSNATPRGVQ